MTTFNVDSLDFVDDEEARFGAQPDFATRFDSANARLELEDLTNATVGYVPQDVGTDLVGGKFAETVAEGKALADDGNVYDTLQEAEINSGSWIKIGPGHFDGQVDVRTTGITIVGSGNQTVIDGTNAGFDIDANYVTVSSMKVIGGKNNGAIWVRGTATHTIVENIYIPKTRTFDAIKAEGDNVLVTECYVENGVINSQGLEATIVNNLTVDNGNIGINTGNNDAIVANNVIKNAGHDGINFSSDDGICIANRVISADGIGIGTFGVDSIVANNRVSNSGEEEIENNGSGTVLDANLTT